ncbi:MAG: thiamine pyrophosphate-dependent enzyme [Candidatus Thermoplasmatota archaeon]|jgi:2-oxoglutarate ferredoxin oxidoreductase subunit beta|nr:thiamine pyrophosphate-dependent enzyme [Candidatus Thermoplasmatota archaeon]MCL5790501.1 thiamine pyrophosphate-dependent enzyme [Candidatus Thermoplasmatota archaeon]
MVTMNDFKGSVKADWCPGCGNYAQLTAIPMALAQLGIKPENTVIVSGIGCSSNMPEYVKAYGFHGIHGRSLPVASAIKWSNPELTVIAYGGDGDGYNEGTQHFYHSARRNPDITYIVSDNQIFGLTTGQASPTSMLGMKTKTTPDGNIEPPINPLSMALSAGATFVAREFSGDVKHMVETIRRAISHKGFAIVDVFSPCVTYNKDNTFDFFRKRVYHLEDEKHDTSDQMAAFKKAAEWGDRIPIGIFYENNDPTYESRDEVLQTPLIKQPVKKLEESDLEEFL